MVRLAPKVSPDAEITLESTIRSRTLSSALPRSPHAVTYSTVGAGNVCVCCDLPMAQGSVQVNVELANGARLSMHRECYDSWHLIATECAAAPNR
jgi:hypothetical protein